MPDTDLTTAAASASEARLRILMIDDDRKLCRLVREYLEPMGYAVESIHNGPEGLERALAGEHQAIILDVMLPGMDGFEILRRLRQKSDVPVLMLTARGDEADRIVGLEIGADDYLPKTFSSRELLARLRAVIRRTGRATTGEAGVPEELVIRELRIQPEARIAILGGQPLTLTPVEFDLLVCLARARGRVKTREQLMEQIRERDFDIFDRSIDVHISSLRKKLGDDPKNPRFIRTLRSAGYMLIHPDHEPA
jgi:DNA-binding response OmpR family regulator